MFNFFFLGGGGGGSLGEGEEMLVLNLLAADKFADSFVVLGCCFLFQKKVNF